MSILPPDVYAFVHRTWGREQMKMSCIKRELVAAAEAGDVNAQYDLAEACFHAATTDDELKSAAHWYKAAAKQRHAMAQNNLGVLYLIGAGMGQSYRKSAYWFLRAARQGNLFAQNNLARVCVDMRNFNEAFAWSMRAAKQGFAPAQNNLGILYAKGLGVDRNFDQAAYWFRQACMRGEINAENNLRELFNTTVPIEEKVVTVGPVRHFAPTALCN